MYKRQVQRRAEDADDAAQRRGQRHREVDAGLDVDAHQRRRVLVLGDADHRLAGLGLLEEQLQGDHDDDGHADDVQIRFAQHGGADVDAAAQKALDGERQRAPGEADDLQHCLLYTSY